MPRYVYECPNCKKTIELERSIDTRDEEVICLECVFDILENIPMKRVMFPGGTGLQFKGTGFYTTDYKKKDKKC